MSVKEKEDILRKMFKVTDSLDDSDQMFILAFVEGYSKKANFQKQELAEKQQNL